MGNKVKLLGRTASFLKVVDGDFSNFLTIPRAFIKHFNGEIPKWFVLEIAGTRKGWRVDTKEHTNGGFFLDYGWTEFVEEQSLQVGDYLLFEYEKPLILQVKIFAKDGTEKLAGTNLDSDHDVDQSPKARCVAEEDLCSIKPTTHHDRLEKFKEVIDRIETETTDQCRVHEKQQSVNTRVETETDYCYGIHEKYHDDNVIDMAAVSGDVTATKHENFDTIDRGTGRVFVTEKSVCYTVVWRNVPHMHYYLTIPRAIVLTRKLSKDETVILEDQEGTTWPMKFRARLRGRVDLVEGWREFLIENNVRDGDILTFEFFSNNVIQVHIERSSEIDLPSATPKKREPVVSFDNICEEPVINYAATDHDVPATKGKTKNVIFDNFRGSSFSVTCRHSANNSYLHIPKAIAKRQKLENKGTVVLCDPEGTKWPMKIKTRPSDGRVGLSEGWSTFWRRHKISYGDTLIFKFVSDHVLNVNIVRALSAHPSLGVDPTMKQEVMQLD